MLDELRKRCNIVVLRFSEHGTKFWELLAQKFDQFQTSRNNMQQGVQTDATGNTQQKFN